MLHAAHGIMPQRTTNDPKYSIKPIFKNFFYAKSINQGSATEADWDQKAFAIIHHQKHQVRFSWRLSAIAELQTLTKL
jgi:hypothetical protein